MNLADYKKRLYDVRHDKKRLRRLVSANLDALGLVHELTIQCRLSNTDVEYTVLIWVDGIRYGYRLTQDWSILSVAQALSELNIELLNRN